MKQYTQLKKGDLVLPYDEARGTRLLDGTSHIYGHTHKTREDSWGPVSPHLIGWEILGADLMHMEFRRLSSL